MVALVGPTASGKSGLALEVAMVLAGSGTTVELVSVDSMAVYRGMDLGTAKPTIVERSSVPYHLVDLAGPSEEFTVARFQEAARGALDAIAARGRPALLVGGTGLYLRSVTDGLTFPGRYADEARRLEETLDAAGPPGGAGERAVLEELHARLTSLDPVAASRIGPHNRRRLVRALEVTVGSGRPFSSFGQGLERYPATSVAMLGLRLDPEEVDLRIAGRFADLLAAGFLDEVRTLAAAPGGLSRTARQALGYRELLAHLEDGVPLDEAVEAAVRRTRAFSRRQMAWFRRDPRIVWVEPGEIAVDSLVARLRGAPAPAVAVGD